MHSCDTLVGYWNPNPGKEPPTVAFFIALNTAAARPAGRCKHYFFPAGQVSQIQRPKKRVAAERLARQRKRPLQGGGSWEVPNKQIFPIFAGAKIGKIAKCIPLCTACHYLRTAKGEVRLNPIRCTA